MSLSKQAGRFGAAALLLALYLGVGVFDHELWAPTEPAVAGVTWEMFREGDLAVPKINGSAYLEKPPLGYLLPWLDFKLAGHASAALLRLPSALLGLASIALVFWIAARLYGERIAWLCALTCASTATFYGIMHRASTDSVALFFTFLCFALFMRTLTPAGDPDSLAGECPPENDAAPSRRRWEVAFCVALAVSFFAKNLYTFLLVVPPVALFLLIRRERHAL